MATRIASASGGAWTAGGTWVGGVAPTAADDAQITVTAGNITVDSGAVCRSADFTGYTGTLTHTAGVTWTIGDATAGLSSIALKLVAGMTYTLGSTTTSAVSFVSTSTTLQTLTSGGKTLGNVTFNGAGGKWQLQDAFTSTAGTVTLTAGTFDTNGQTWACSIFSSSNTNTRTITLGSSAVTVSSSGTNAWQVTAVANLTVTANTATVTMSAAGGFISGTKDWNGLSVIINGVTTSSVGATGATVTLANFTRTGTAVKTDSLTVTSNLIVTGLLTLTGNSTVNRLFVTTSSPGTQQTVTAATVALTNVDFMDIAGAGAANPFTGTSLGDCLGNTNITFDGSTTQTHTASAGGNWSDATKWTSRVPLPQDDVVVNASTTGTLSFDMARAGRNIDFTGFAGTFTVLANMRLFGNYTLATGMTYTNANSSTITFSGRSSSHTITSSGKTFTQALVSVTAPNGTYTLQDAFIGTGASGLRTTDGTLTANNFGVTATLYTMSGGTTNMGSGTWTMTYVGGVNFWNVTAGTLNASTSTIVLSLASATTRTFVGGGKTYNILTHTVAGSTGPVVITGSNTFGTINFSDITNARSLLFTAGTTTTITTAFNVNGTAGKLMTIDSVTAATHTLTKGLSVVSSDYLSIKNSVAVGGAAWFAGANSTNISGNTGWIFSAPPSGNFFFLLA